MKLRRIDSSTKTCQHYALPHDRKLSRIGPFLPTFVSKEDKDSCQKEELNDLLDAKEIQSI